MKCTRAHTHLQQLREVALLFPCLCHTVTASTGVGHRLKLGQLQQPIVARARRAHVPVATLASQPAAAPSYVPTAHVAVVPGTERALVAAVAVAARHARGGGGGRRLLAPPATA